MSIRTRLILIFGSLAVLVVVSAAISVATLYQMNRQGDEIFSDILQAAAKSLESGVPQAGEAVSRGKQRFDSAIANFSIRQAALVAMALLLIGGLSVYLQRNVLIRLDRLRAFSAGLAAGRSSLRLNLLGNDELTALAGRLNAALDHQSSLRAEMIGRLNQMKALTLALLAAQEHPAALLDLAGEILASTLDEGTEDAVENAREAIRDLDLSHEGPHEVSLGDGRRAQLVLLRKGSVRPTGWLLTT